MFISYLTMYFIALILLQRIELQCMLNPYILVLMAALVMQSINDSVTLISSYHLVSKR
jgi:hypothetical protein